jgi:hypothetical protein
VVIEAFYNTQSWRWRLHQLLLQIMHAFNNHATTTEHCSSILQFVKSLFCGTIHAHVFFATMHLLALVAKHGCACGPHCRSLSQNYLHFAISILQKKQELCLVITGIFKINI